MTHGVGAQRVESADRERAVVMRTLLLDAVAARAVALLEEHGVSAILLKGRVTADWLYRGAVRNYGDVDLLVGPAQRDRAMEVLAKIGYRHWLEGADRTEYGPNETELVGPNRTCIDLHHTLLGVTAPPARCWEILSRRTTRMSVGGRTVTVLDPAARTMHLALHAAQNGPSDVKAVADLQHGVSQLPVELWREAERIARSIDATDAFAAGLRVLATGRRLASQLSLPPVRDVELVLRTSSAPAEALQIQKFVEADSIVGRLRFAGRKLWPTAAYMLGRAPAARTGGASLFVARLRRMTGLPGKFGVAFWSWRRARRAVRAQATTGITSTGQRVHP